MLSGLHSIFASKDLSHIKYILYKQFLYCNGYSLALLTFTLDFNTIIDNDETKT